jgi:hypothetical protein
MQLMDYLVFFCYKPKFIKVPCEIPQSIVTSETLPQKKRFILGFIWTAN